MTDDERQILDRAREINRRYEAEVRKVRQDDFYTREGRQDQLRDLYERTEGELEELRSELADVRAKARRSAAEQVFQPSDGPLVTREERTQRQAEYRQALVEAARAKDRAELGELLRLARRAEDETLARAVATVAFERGEMEVLGGFMAMRPKYLDQVVTLLQSGGNREAETGAHFRPEVPHELPLAGRRSPRRRAADRITAAFDARYREREAAYLRAVLSGDEDPSELAKRDPETLSPAQRMALGYARAESARQVVDA